MNKQSDKKAGVRLKTVSETGERCQLLYTVFTTRFEGKGRQYHVNVNVNVNVAIERTNIHVLFT